MRQDLYGFGGWLIVFVIFGCGFPLLIDMTRVYSALIGGAAEMGRQYISNWTFFSISLLTFLVCEFIVLTTVAYRLAKKYRPSTILLTRITILMTAFVFPFGVTSITSSFLGYSPFETVSMILADGPRALVQSIIWATIWTLYFATSKRVKVTYLNQPEDHEVDDVFA
ncbi:DUF2569 domain-containing protein [Parasphingopyxis sp. CP4]|uniref:DUF2569 family protein n=1 Tax=Parasphingopyxis sp. CP4 TaxID=2724527 RepID=UPI0015A373B2|nr:DUF2569 family protein [Parasphingopyxis sp. CP4]QLC22796.1 DUF2569 domain-containing protein [Parasphingopyxis sp. CP4]